MPRSYLRTLPDLYERKAFGTDKHPPYPPAAIACFVGVLCFGEQQPERGRFKSRRLLAVLLEGPTGVGKVIARQVGFLIDHGDLVELPDGSLYIEGWDELQEGNWQVAERMGRYRDRRKGVTPPVTPDVTVPTVTVQSRVDSGKRIADSGKHMAEAARETYDGREDLEAFLIVRRRAPTPKQRRLLDEVLDRHDLTGPAWAADLIYRNPDDPIGAVLEADKAWRAERIAQAQAAERPKPIPRRSRGLPQTTREIMAEMALLRKESA